jgi:autotransporter-associated beta strand protein
MPFPSQSRRPEQANPSMKQPNTSRSRISSARFLFLPLILLFVAGVWSPIVQANILSWSGGSGASANWSDIANWGFAGTPANGDTLIFPGGAARLTNTNNIASLTVGQIRFVGASGGYNIYGIGFVLTNGIAATNSSGANTNFADITFGSSDQTMEVGPGVNLTLSDSLGGSGAVVKIGAGTLVFAGVTANSYTNVTFVNAGKLLLAKSLIDSSLHGPLIIGDGVGGVNADVVQLANNEQLSDSVTPVTINSSGLFDLNGVGEFFGSLSGSGNMTLGVGSPRIGYDNTSTTFTGIISGPAGLFKRGTGTLTFTGNNSYLGTTEIDSGTLVVNGLQPQSPLLLSGGTLGGTGAVGIITSSSGTVAPGAGPGTGILTSSNLTLNASTTFRVDLGGATAGVNYDQLNVRGTNSLANALLSLNVNLTNTVALSNQLVIINNDSIEPINGIFQGYASGSSYATGNGYNLVITYTGGDGNDVAFIITQLPGDIAGATVASGNGNGIIDPNECNNLYIAITNKNGTAMSGINATLSSATPPTRLLPRTAKARMRRRSKSRRSPVSFAAAISP